MQLIMNDWFKAARKKLCEHSDKYTFIRNGKTFSGTRCNPYTGPATAKQQANRQKFSQAMQVLKLIIADEQLKQDWHDRYMASRKSKTTNASSLNGYIVQQYYDGHVSETGAVNS